MTGILLEIRGASASPLGMSDGVLRIEKEPRVEGKEGLGFNVTEEVNGFWAAEEPPLITSMKIAVRHS